MASSVPSTVDLENCDREPIHLLGLIDAAGCLFAFSADWMLVHVSANCGDFAGAEPEALLGRTAAEIFAADALHEIRGRLQWLQLSETSERLFAFDLFGDERRWDLSIAISQGLVIVEAEHSLEGGRIDAISIVRTMINRLGSARTLNDFFDQAARQVRFVTGFDRVMVYQFLQDGSGEVVAESLDGDAESFLGLRYPATDIPQQARALYLRNLLRQIPDVDGETSAIVPPTSPEGVPLDLSLSVLRSVSPTHLQYLRNMGVGASLSISIVIDGELWGLFACHNLSPKRTNFDRRTAAELFAQMFSLELANRLRTDIYQLEATAREVHDRIMASATVDGSVFDSLSEHLSPLSNLIECGGVGVWVDGQYAMVGRGPRDDEMAGLVRFLNRAGASRVFATNELSQHYPEARNFADQTAGILAIPVSRSPRDYLVFFRDEVAQSVQWAGNPEKPAELDSNGAQLTPRKSFAAWRELVRNKSQAWTDAERRIAESLRTTLLEVILRHSDHRERVRRQEEEKQNLLIDELNHRVRNILCLIRAIATQSGESASDVKDFVRVLDDRVQSLARAHDQLTQENWTAAPMDSLVRNEVDAYLSEHRDRITLEGPHVALEPRAYTSVALVLHELITNSVKYGSLSNNHGALNVAWWLNDNDDLIIDWRESGGPAVTRVNHQGFGTTLIERSIPYDLNGKAEVNFEVSGVTAQFLIPARFVHPIDPDDDDSDAGITPERMSAIADGASVLLVEDNLIIAMDAEAMLHDIGFEKVVTANTVESALDVISKDCPDIAVLDINLGRTTSVAVAQTLQRDGVRFVFSSGYGDRFDMPAGLAEVPVLTKPYTADNLRETVTRLFDT